MGGFSSVVSDTDISAQLSPMQRTLLASITATAQKLTLEQKAAMDEATYTQIAKTGNNYAIEDAIYKTLVTPSFGSTENFPDLAAWTVVGSGLSVVANELSWTAMGGTNVSYIHKTITSTNTFMFRTKVKISAGAYNGGILIGLSQTNTEKLSAAQNSLYFAFLNGGNSISLVKRVNGTPTGSSTSYTTTLDTNYYVEFYYDGTTGYAQISVFSDPEYTTILTSINLTGLGNVSYTTFAISNTTANVDNTSTGKIDTLLWDSTLASTIAAPLTANLKSAAIAKDTNIGLRYWSDIVCNFVAGASGSTVKVKILNSTGTPLHTNFVTIASTEYARIPLERPIVLTAASGSQTVWNFTSLTNADAFINELGVLAKALLVELALDGTNYTVLKEVTDFNEDISNILAPKITLVSGTGVISGTSKLRATYIVNIPLSNTTIKLQVQLNRVAGADTSPSIQPFVGDATKYISAGQVAIV